MTPKEYNNHRSINAWNVFFSLLFPVLLAGAGFWFYRYGTFPTSISLPDFLILSLAIFRVTRLVVYDHITLFLREAFMKKVASTNSSGVQTVTFIKETRGLKGTIGTLLGCPWCTGMWVAFFITFIYFAIPESWPIWLMLAIAGFATVLLVLGNLIGWHAEYRKQMTLRDFGEDAR